jgi:hypothetical protein
MEDFVRDYCIDIAEVQWQHLAPGSGRIVPALKARLWPRYTIFDISGGHIIRVLRSIAAQIIESKMSARMAMEVLIIAAWKIRFCQIPFVTEFLFSNSLPGVDLGLIFYFQNLA